LQIALDLKAAHGKAKFYELLATADAIIENYRPGVMQRLGLGWQNLHAKYPRLVMCSISGFGQSGPSSQRPAMDTVAQALSGLMSVTGLPDQPPHGHGAKWRTMRLYI
jgi:CoA:oxalate CoA-transferase